MTLTPAEQLVVTLAVESIAKHVGGLSWEDSDALAERKFGAPIGSATAARRQMREARDRVNASERA